MFNSLASIGTAHTKKFGVPKLSGKIQFNGSNYLSTIQTVNFGTGQFTIEFWYKPIRASNINAQQTPIGFGPNNTSFGVYFNIGTDAKISFVSEIGTYVKHTAPTVPNITEWNHIVVQRNSAGRIQIYINGILDYTSATSVTTAFTTGTAGYVIGRVNATSTSNLLLSGSQITGIRLSSIARYSANFTPSTDQIAHQANDFAVFNFKTSSTYLQTENNAYSLTNNGSVTWVSGYP